MPRLKGNKAGSINRSMNLINVSPGDLEAFLAVADAGSFRGAARQLGMSQPAISARVQHLEAVLGVSLFERTTRRVTITDAGERLRQRTEPMVGELRGLVREFKDEAQLKRGRLTLGASPSVAASILPVALRSFHQRWPAVELVLFDDFFGRVLDRVTRGEVDMAVIPFEPEQTGLVFELLMTDAHLVALPRTHALAQARTLTLREIAGLPLITMPPQSAAWTTLRRSFEAAGLEFRPAFQTRNALTSLAMVRAGLGVALVTRLLASVVTMPDLVMVPIQDRGLTRDIGIVTGERQTPSAAARSMRAMLHEVAHAMTLR